MAQLFCSTALFVFGVLLVTQRQFFGFSPSAEGGSGGSGGHTGTGGTTGGTGGSTGGSTGGTKGTQLLSGAGFVVREEQSSSQFDGCGLA